MGEIDRKIREIYNYIGFNLGPKMTQLLKMGKFSVTLSPGVKKKKVENVWPSDSNSNGL